MSARIHSPIIAAALLALMAMPVQAQEPTPYTALPGVAAAPEPTPEEVIEQLTRRLAQAEQALANHRVLLDQARAEIALKDELIVLGRERNAELYATAQEILQRYSDVGFLEVAGRREPFVQSMRVRLENQKQDYEDRLRAARIYETTLPPSVQREMDADLERRRQAAAEQAEPAPAAAPTPNQ